LATLEDFMSGYYFIYTADNKLTAGALHKLAQGNWRNLEAIDISNNLVIKIGILLGLKE
jgi:hypothetical protein